MIAAQTYCNNKPNNGCMSINIQKMLQTVFSLRYKILNATKLKIFLDLSIQWLELFINLDEDLFLEHNTFHVQNSSGYRVMMDFIYFFFFTVPIWQPAFSANVLKRTATVLNADVKAVPQPTFLLQREPWVHVKLTKVLDLLRIHRSRQHHLLEDCGSFLSYGPAHVTWSIKNQCSSKQNMLLQLRLIKPVTSQKDS